MGPFPASVRAELRPGSCVECPAATRASGARREAIQPIQRGMAMTGLDDADDAAGFDQLLSRLREHPARPAKNICEPVRDPERAVGAIARLKPVEQCERVRLHDQRFHIGLEEP